MLHKINAAFFTHTFSHARIKPVTGFCLIKNMNNFLQRDFSPVSLLKPNLVLVNKIRSAFIICPQIDN